MKTSGKSGSRAMSALTSVVLLDSIGYALILPLLPFILEAHDAGALTGGLLTAAYAFMAAISAPLLGVLSDRFGRRPVILLPLLGRVLAHILFAFSGSLASLFLSRLLAGAMAGSTGVVQAAVADASPGAKRGKAMAMLSAAWALGFVLGPAVGAILPHDIDYIAFWPGILAALASGAAFISVAGLYRTEKIPGAAQSGEADAIGAAGTCPWSRHELLGLFGATAMIQTGLVAMTGFWVSHTFGWNAAQVSILFLWAALFTVGVQIALLPGLIDRFDEGILLLGGVLVTFLAAAVFLMFPQSALVLIVTSPVLLGGITTIQTLCTTLLSRLSADRSRGALLGYANSAAAIGRVIGPALCGLLFAKIHPTAPYWLVAVLTGAGFTWLAARRARAGRHASV